MDFETALVHLKARIKNPKVILHSKAISSIMREFARIYKEDEEKWAICGLFLHIDNEYSKYSEKNKDAILTEILTDLEVDRAIIYSIRSQFSPSSFIRKRKMDKLLQPASIISSFILECCKLLSISNIKHLSVEVVMNHLNNSEFFSQEQQTVLLSHLTLGIELEEFVTISLRAMQNISDDSSF